MAKLPQARSNVIGFDQRGGDAVGMAISDKAAGSNPHIAA
jgi:hypothetical protein